MKKTLFCIIALFISAAFAQSKPKRSNKPTVYDFGEVDILGKLKKPEGASIKERPDTYFKRLLDLDESFIPNIVRSVEDF